MAVCPQLPELSRDLIDNRKLNFDILWDEGSQVARAYGLEYNLPDYLLPVYQDLGIRLDEANGESAWRLPIPALYIVGADGVVRYARVHPDYTTRPEPAETVAALQALVAG